MALLLPAHVETILTPLSWLDIASADPDVVLHTNWTLVFSKLDLAVLWHIDLSFLFSFTFAFRGLVVVVLGQRLACGRRGVLLRFWCRGTLGGAWHRHDVVLHFWMQ